MSNICPQAATETSNHLPYPCIERKPLIPYINFETPAPTIKEQPSQLSKRKRIKWNEYEDEILRKHFDPET
jgi:hypothetical protein